MLAIAAIAAFCFLLRLTGGKTLLDNPLIACYAYYALAVGIVLLGKSMAASDDVQRGSRLVTIGTWLFIAPALAASLIVAGLLLVFSLGLLTGWFSPFD